MIIELIVDQLLWTIRNLTGSLKVETALGDLAPHSARVTIGGQPRDVEGSCADVVSTIKNVNLRDPRMTRICGRQT